MTRLLVLELSDDSEMCTSDASDDFTFGELGMLALYLMAVAEAGLRSDPAISDEDE